MLSLTDHANLVIAGGFAAGILFGWVAQRSRFCTLGALSDIVAMGDWTRMRMWGTAIGVAILGTAILTATGTLATEQTLYGSSSLRWLAHTFGGLCFGIGMVLASGCGSKTLIRIGTGSLKALVAALCLAIAGAATLHGLLGSWRTGFLDVIALQLPAAQDLPSLLAAVAGWHRTTTHLALSVILGGTILGWALWTREARRGEALLGGLGVGMAVLAGWVVTAHIGHLAEHPETLQEAWLATNTGRPESLSFIAPQAYALELLLLWTDNSRTLSFGIACAVGTVLGAAIAAQKHHEFRIEGFRSTQDLVHHMLGGTLMGFGGVTALGCTIGQGITGIGTLALGSLITLVAILTGATAALHWQYHHGVSD